MRDFTRCIVAVSFFLLGVATSRAQQEDISFVGGGHSLPINQTVLSPDGRTIATASDDATVKIWDVERGSLLRTLWGHASEVHAVAFSLDGSYLASGDADGTVRVWSMTGFDNVRVMDGFSGEITSLAWLADRGILAGTSDGMVFGRELANGSQIASFRAYEGSVARVLASADGELIVTLRTRSQVDVFNGVPWSADSTKIWSALGDTLLHLFPSTLYAVTFSPDESQLALAGRESIRLLNPWTAQESDSIAIRGIVLDMAFTPGGTSLGFLTQTEFMRFAPRKRAMLDSFSVTSEDQYWRRYGGSLLLLPGDYEFVMSVTSPEPLNGDIYPFPVPLLEKRSTVDGELLQVLQGHTHPVTSLAFGRDGSSLLSASQNRVVSIDAGTDQVSIRQKGAENNSISPEGEFYASAWTTVDVGFGGNVYYYAADGQLAGWVGGVPMTSGPIVHAVAPGAESLLYSTPAGKKVWDTTTKVSTPHRNAGTVYSFDGERLAGAVGGTVGIWGLHDSIPTMSLPTGTPVRALAFSRDGSMLVSGHSDGRFSIWDLNAQRELGNYGGHDAAISAVTFSRNGRFIITAGLDSTVRIWSVATGELQYIYDDYPSAQLSVSISADSKFIASGAADGSVIIWHARGEVSGVESEVVPLMLDLSEK